MAHRGSTTDRIILELAAASDGVVHARDLRAAGVTSAQVCRRVAIGAMGRIVGDCYAVGPGCAAPSRPMLLRAGLLHAKSSSVLTGTTAAVELGAWNRRVRAIEVAAPRTVSCADPRFSFSKLSQPPPRMTVDGRAVMAPVALCLHLGRSMTAHQLAFVIRALRHEGLITLADLDRALAGARGRAGARTVREALHLVRAGSAGTRGATEDELLRLIGSAGLEMPLVNHRGAAGLPGDEPDFLFMRARLNVECDGGHHDTPEHARDDAERDRYMRATGWRVLRVNWRHVWNDPAGVMRRIRHVLDHDELGGAEIARLHREISAADGR